jgi:hypothetical protein
MARDDRRWGKWRNWWMDVAEGRIPEITDGAAPWTMKQVLVARKWSDEDFEWLKEMPNIGRGRYLSSRLRSLRRALAGLVDDGHIIAIGKPSNPHRRYIIHPHWFKEDDPRRERIAEILDKHTWEIGEREYLNFAILDSRFHFGQRMLARIARAAEELDKGAAT